LLQKEAAVFEKKMSRHSFMTLSAATATFLVTGNPEGAIFELDQTVGSAFMNRLTCRTAIKGLDLAGSWATLGGGYCGALSGGEKTFKMIPEDWGG
jgi:phytoene dehydrogenase-like protein